jgi:hypothetical protein
LIRYGLSLLETAFSSIGADIVRLDIHEVTQAATSHIKSADISYGQTVIDGLRESTRYWLAVTADAPLVAYVDDVRLESSPNATTWVWDSGFCIGSARLEFVDLQDNVVAVVILGISSDDNKLSRAELDNLLDDLLRLAPDKLSGDGQTSLTLGARGQVLGNVQFERVRKYAPLFCNALRACQRSPHTNFETRSHSVSIERVRRLSRRNLSDPRVVAYSASTLAKSADERPPVVVTERPERNLDTLPNRSLWTMAKKVLRVVESLREHNRAASLRPDEEGFARSKRRVVLLDELAASLRSGLDWFVGAGIKPNQDVSSGLAQMLRIPAYARAVRLGGLACSQSFDAIDRRDAELPLNSSWGLYEEWCFERVRLALETVVGVTARRVSNVFGASADAYVFETPHQKVILAAQATFRSGSEPRADIERYSLSRERRPDTVLIVSGREHTRWYVFDAKYRRSKANVLDAMASAHIYRDALLLNGKRCSGAILLAPGTAFDARWSIFAPSHWRTFGTGVVPDFRPDGHGLAMMTALLASVISPPAACEDAQSPNAACANSNRLGDIFMSESDTSASEVVS